MLVTWTTNSQATPIPYVCFVSTTSPEEDLENIKMLVESYVLVVELDKRGVIGGIRGRSEQ